MEGTIHSEYCDTLVNITEPKTCQISFTFIFSNLQNGREELYKKEFLKKEILAQLFS